jgi:hypothetical protein
MKYTFVKVYLCSALYYTIIADLDLPDIPRKILGLLMGAFIAFGFAAFVQVRCICALSIPMFVSRNGRRYLSAVSIVLLLKGETYIFAQKYVNPAVYGTVQACVLR